MTFCSFFVLLLPCIVSLVTVLEAIQKSAEFLGRKGVDSPRLQSELLLAYVLSLPRLKLYLNFERPLANAEVENLRELVKRRGQREPLQHILGMACFCGLDLAVNRDVLVPRPETEVLAERGWEKLTGWRKNGRNSPVVVDFGTGSGALALALASKFPEARIHGLEVSKAALATAEQNGVKHGLNIQFHLGDGFALLRELAPIDLLISNPPYIPLNEIPSLQPEVRDFDPHLALAGGVDGLEFFRRLAVETVPAMASGGCCMVEFGDGQSQAVRGLFEEAGWIEVQICPDNAGCPRILIAQRP